MADKEFSIDNQTEHENTLTFEDRVIKKIAGIAASEIPGILAMSGNLITGLTDKLKSADDPTKGITVEVGTKQTAIDMKIVCEYGRNIPAIFQDIVDRISQSIKEMTGLEVVEINVHVVDVLLKEDFENKKRIAISPEADLEPQPVETPRRVE